MRIRPFLHGLAILSLATATAQAANLDLLEAYRLASQHDPQIAAAEWQLRADREQIPQARSLVLPQLGLQGEVNRIWEDSEFAGMDSEVTYTAYNAGVGLRQSLFRADAFIALQQARYLADQAELRYDLARQQLVLRVADAYFGVLRAHDALVSYEAEVRAIETQRRRAQRAFELGSGTITDVNDAQARLDATRARQVAVRNDLRIARERLRRLTASSVDELAGLTDTFEPEPPQPHQAQEWAEFAERNNLQVRVAESALELSGREIARQRAARYPQVELVGNLGQGHQGDVTQIGPAGAPVTDDVTTDRASIGVTLTMPLYTGGAVSARVREAIAQREVGYHRLLDAKREAALSAESAYLTLTANLESVHALEQALRSIRSTEASTERGLELGLRDTLDLLNIQRERFEVERSLAEARYGYLLTYLQLMASIGDDLEETALPAINRFLVHTAP